MVGGAGELGRGSPGCRALLVLLVVSSLRRVSRGSWVGVRRASMQCDGVAVPSGG